jgi:hypothetical protein
MSITYDAQILADFSTWIVSPGQLVRIKQNCFEQTGVFGIIIGCIYPDFGIGADKWLVLSEGKLITFESSKLWPI